MLKQLSFRAAAGALSGLLAVAGLFGSGAALADGEILTPENLVELSAIGLEEFRSELGEEAYSQIYAITTLRNEDGDGATLKYYYGNREDAVYATFFCHEHDPGELDCHEVPQ